MNHNLIITLWITALGMGLVFSAIFLLWLFMSLLVKFTSGKMLNTADANFIAHATETNKKRAAVAAIIVALARQESQFEPHEFPLPPTASVSPWQAVMRTKMLNKRGQVR
jgi:Na+-transporting methylmalonyl-CoA/oxaloacetate decarboxylase gamma subunit